MRLTIVQGAFFPVPPLRGGAVEKVWHALGRELATKGIQVVHVSRRFAGLPNDEVVDGVRHIRINGADAPSNVLLHKLADLAYSLRARGVIPPSDVVVTNTFWLPIIGVPRHAGNLYVHVARYPRGQMRWYGKAARLQCVSRAVSEAVKAEAPQLKDRVCTLPYPLPTDRWANPDFTQGSASILYAGRIHPEKGLGMLMEAVRELQSRGGNFGLTIVGPWQVAQGGGGDSYLNSLKAALGDAERFVTFLDPIYDGNELASVYRRHGIFVYPSLAEKGESFGVAPLEAMSNGCFPVVSSLDCFRDFIEPGVTGVMFDHRAQDASSRLATALYDVCAPDSGLSERRRAAWLRAGNFELSKVARMYQEDLEQVAQR
jgi:glycosyltransferase involved in cell wall biosynthesis